MTHLTGPSAPRTPSTGKGLEHKGGMRPHREALQAGWRDSIQVGEVSRSTASRGCGDQVPWVLGAEGGITGAAGDPCESFSHG